MTVIIEMMEDWGTTTKPLAGAGILEPAAVRIIMIRPGVP
jgi:hypothetical protein